MSDDLFTLSVQILDVARLEVLDRVNIVGAGGATATLLSRVGLWHNDISEGPYFDEIVMPVQNLFFDIFGNYNGFRSSSDQQISSAANAVYQMLENNYVEVINLYFAFVYGSRTPIIKIKMEEFLFSKRDEGKGNVFYNPGGAMHKADEEEPRPPDEGNQFYNPGGATHKADEEEPNPPDDYEFDGPDYGFNDDTQDYGNEEKKATGSSNIIYFGIAAVVILFLLKGK